GEQRVGLLLERAPQEPVEPAVEAEQLAPGEPVLEAEVLGQEADARARRAVADRSAEQRAAARRGRDQAQEHLERRGLARAVRAQEAEYLAALDRDGQVRDGELVAESLAQAPGLDDGNGHGLESTPDGRERSPPPARASRRSTQRLRDVEHVLA